MNDRKALANSFYALIASMSLMAGMTVLSLAGPGNQDEVSTPGDMNVSPELPGNVSLPGNTTPQTPETNLSVDQQPRLREDGLMAGAARELFRLLSGQQFRPPDADMGGSNPSGGNVTPPNMSDTNMTAPNRSDTNSTLPNGSISNGSMPESGNISQQGSGGNTTGFFQGLLKGLGEMFDFSGNSSAPEKPEVDQPEGNMTGPDTRNASEPDDEENSSSPSREDDGNRTGSIIPENLPSVLPGLVLIALAALAFIIYRSDAELGKIIRALAGKMKQFVVSLPDLFRRTVVRSVVFVTTRIRKAVKLMISMLEAPVRTTEQLIENVEKRIISVRRSAALLKTQGIFGFIRRFFPGEKEPEGGLELVWYMLKSKAGLERDKTLTPKEIGDRAREQGVDTATVDEVVEAYRWEKYSPEGYPGKIDVEDWKERLGGDDG